MRRAHPAVILAVALLPAIVLLVTIDPLTPVLVGITCTTVLLWVAQPLPGAVRVLPLLGVVAVSAAGAFVVNALYGVPGGDLFAQWGFAQITERSVTLGAAQASRALAIGIPAVLLARSLVVSTLAAWLSSLRIVPPRFALATLIGIRLVPVIVSDVAETITARRARGLGVNPFAAAVTVIVVAIRRAVRMSEIAEIRGFASDRRVWSSFEPVRAWDVSVLLVAVLGVSVSIAVTVATGMWDVLRA